MDFYHFVRNEVFFHFLVFGYMIAFATVFRLGFLILIKKMDHLDCCAFALKVIITTENRTILFMLDVASKIN